MRVVSLLVLIVMGRSSAISAEPAPHPQSASAVTAHQTQEHDWDLAFADHSRGGPVHFKAGYRDSRGGTHQLEEWRLGSEHLRRRTDERIELHADLMQTAARAHPAQEYQWQVVDLQKRIVHRMTTQGMLRAGMLYNFWSTAHVLVRPAGRVSVQPLAGQAGVHVGRFGCKWFAVEPDGQPATRVCWAPEIGAPLRIETRSPRGEWTATFEVEAADRKPLPHGVFAVDTAGMQVRDVDQLAADDD